jgi:hypothetical protein
MNRFNVKQAAEEALRILVQNGASAKTVKGYRATGFGAFVRYFSEHSSLDVTTKMLDAFVLEERKRFENGEFSNWRWLLVRRGGELLKQYAENDNIEVSMLRPWEPVLRRPRQSIEKDIPTAEQLADPDDIFALIWRVKQELIDMGLTRSTARHYSAEGLTVIMRKHTNHGLQQYSESLVEELVFETRKRYESGQTPRTSYQNLRKASFLLSEMHKTGKITLQKIPKWGQREPLPVFAELLRHFCDNAEHTGVLATSTIKCARSAIRAFLFELEEHGFESFEGVTLA